MAVHGIGMAEALLGLDAAFFAGLDFEV